MDINKQIKSNLLVSPDTGKVLAFSEDQSLSSSAGEHFALLNGSVPLLLPKGTDYDCHVNENQTMSREYSDAYQRKRVSLAGQIKKVLLKSYPSKKSQTVFGDFIGCFTQESLVLSIGGGPVRAHEFFTNLNIGPFPNVDLVADAYSIPYADSVVEGIHCDAVIEHIKEPDVVVKEMRRVLKPGSFVYSVIPFLQGYHGYPYHFQNFTLTGHEELYRKHGFEIIEKGVCVGPAYVFTALPTMFIRELMPRKIVKPLLLLWELFASFIRPLDIMLTKLPNAHMLASTTFVLARKG